jgi:threonine aldolase
MNRGRVLRHRRMLGGAMRHTDIYAAAGLFAIEHHRERLAEAPSHRGTRARQL